MDGVAGKVLGALSRVLPRHSEEGNVAESTEESVLRSALERDGMAPESAEVAVGLVGRLLVAAGLIDPTHCARNIWRFRSFPCYLAARSLLELLAEESQRLLEPGFWDDSEYRVEDQRKLLRKLELARSPDISSAVPIRRVWVSWALMAVDGRFLAVRREDPNPNREGARGEFVLPGGKVSLEDLPVADAGRHLDFFDPRVAQNALPWSEVPLLRALNREVHEELGITDQGIANREALETITYRDLEGARSAHAVTEYLVRTYRLTLTAKGKQQLLNELAKHPDRFAWFAPDEILAGVNARNQTIYARALSAARCSDASDLPAPNRSDLNLSDTETVEDPIEVPWGPDDRLTLGPTGRERYFAHRLSAEACGILCFLAAVRRGETVERLQPRVTVVPVLGFVNVCSDEAWAQIDTLRRTLAENSESANWLTVTGRAVRLNVAGADLCYYSRSAFTLEVADEGFGKRFLVRVTRRRIECPLGSVTKATREVTVSAHLGNALYDFVSGKVDPLEADIDNIKREQRAQLSPLTQSLGLRGLIRQDAGKAVLGVVESRAI